MPLARANFQPYSILLPVAIGTAMEKKIFLYYTKITSIESLNILMSVEYMFYVCIVFTGFMNMSELHIVVLMVLIRYIHVCVCLWIENMYVMEVVSLCRSSAVLFRHVMSKQYGTIATQAI